MLPASENWSRTGASVKGWGSGGPSSFSAGKGVWCVESGSVSYSEPSRVFGGDKISF